MIPKLLTNLKCQQGIISLKDRLTAHEKAPTAQRGWHHLLFHSHVNLIQDASQHVPFDNLDS